MTPTSGLCSTMRRHVTVIEDHDAVLNLRRRKRSKVFRTFAVYALKKIGLVLSVVLMTVLGALCFQALEKPNELKTCLKTAQVRGSVMPNADWAPLQTEGFKRRNRQYVIPVASSSRYLQIV